LLTKSCEGSFTADWQVEEADVSVRGSLGTAKKDTHLTLSIHNMAGTQITGRL
jgi:hypothetical protein